MAEQDQLRQLRIQAVKVQEPQHALSGQRGACHWRSRNEAVKLSPGLGTDPAEAPLLWPAPTTHIPNHCNIETCDKHS